MRHIKSWARHIVGVVASTLLFACGGGEGPTFVPQFNVTERELYEPGRADSGIVAQRGSGGISLQLEAPAGIPLPWDPLPGKGDTATAELDKPIAGVDKPIAGVDRFYFDLVNTGYINLSMSDEMLSVIDKVELYDANKMLWRADAANREITNYWLIREDYRKPAPRYEVRIYAPAGAVDTSHVLAWFGDGLVSTANPHDFSTLSASKPPVCMGCNFSGAQLGAYQWIGATLHNVDFRNSWLVRVLDDAALSLGDFNLFKILWSSKQVAGAKMSKSTLHTVDFSGAILTGAGNSPADFTDSTLTNVSFNGVNLDGVSIGGRSTISGVKFIRASMVAADMTGVTADDINFKFANLSKAKFTKSTMQNIDFSDALLSHADFKQATLGVVNFSGANLSHADFTGANLGNVNFTNADLGGATWQDGRTCAAHSVGSCLQISTP